MPIVLRTPILVAALTLSAAWLPVGCTSANLAPLGKATASSVWQDSAEMSPDKAIDGKLSTRWGGKQRGEWFQVEWPQPRTMSAVVVRNFDADWNKNIPFTIEAWDGAKFTTLQTVTPRTAVFMFRFEPVTTTRLRLSNCITFWELEVYDDPEEIRIMHEAIDGLTISVAGDVRGRMIGTVSQSEGAIAVAGSNVKATGSSPLGRWTRTATTDAEGLFAIDVPLGAAGEIRVAAESGGIRADARVDAADIATRLTPKPPTPAKTVSLEGSWSFAPDPPAAFPSEAPAKWQSIKVPSHWEMEGFVAETGRAAYQRKFSIPANWKGKRIRFRSEGVYSHAEVWLNGVRVGGHDGGATPFDLDITNAAKPGAENVISMLVRDHSPAGDLDAMSYYAHFNLGGIWRPLEVFCVEPAHVSRLALSTDFDPDYRDAELQIELTLANEQAKEIKGAELRLALLDPSGKRVAVEGLSTKLSLGPWERRDVSLKARVKSPQHWNAEVPRLYTLRAELETGGISKAVTEQRFGFRETEIKGRTFVVNGKPIKMWGSCRHDADPLLGRAITSETVQEDVELMKGANLNSLRTAHYPPHPELLAAADEAGLYVEDEAPFCFVSVGYGPHAGRERDLSNDLRLAPLCISLTSEMLERDRNHPSVVMWSQCNESVFGQILQMAYRFLRRSEPTRPVGAGQSANLEIATYHNPTSMARMKDTADFTAPVLFDEGMAIFQGLGSQVHGLELDPGLRDFWISGHFEPIQAIRESEHHLGVQIWAWVDDAFLIPGKGIEYGRMNMGRTHVADDVYKLPGRGIVGDPMWGVIEAWRRPRPEWWLCKKLFSPIHIEERTIPISSTLEIPVENRNAFSNLDIYVCKWELGNDSGEVRPDVAPGRKGVLTVRLSREPSSSEVLSLRFHDATDRLIDGYNLCFRDHEVPVLPVSGEPARIVEDPGSLDYASLIRLLGKRSELAFDRTSGGLMRGIADREQVILGGPVLHILKSWAPAEQCPTGWSFTGADYRTESGMAVLDWNGHYGEQFTGGFTIRMDDAGCVELSYSFTYTGEDLAAREMGLSLEVPLACDTLEWDRDAEWSCYPEEHIGRPRGVAKAHPNVPQTTPPGNRPFSLDDHAWGCNDFRSTKRNIYSASLTDGNGAGIKVFSDGTQHVRATVSPHSISVKILDYYGGSATGWNEWDGAYGIGHVIKKSDVLKGTARLQLLAPSQ